MNIPSKTKSRPIEGPRFGVLRTRGSALAPTPLEPKPRPNTFYKVQRAAKQQAEGHRRSEALALLA